MQSNNKKILVSGASGIVGYGILKSLRIYNNYKLIGTTIYKQSPANCFADIFELAPKTSDENYIDWLIDIIKKYSIDIIIPGIEADMYAWNNNRSVIEKTGVKILLNNSDLINLCEDKFLFYQTIKNTKYAILSELKNDFEYLSHNLGLPFLIKPRKGFGSKDIYKINNAEEYNIYKSFIGTTHLAQQIIGTDEEEYTVSAFFDNDSNLLYFHQLKRKLSKDGYTEIAETVELDNISNILNDLAAILKPIGPTNFQFRKDNNQLKLLEVNPRISSSTSIRAKFNYNESKIAVDYYLEGIKPKVLELKFGKVIRYIEDYVIYDNSNNI